MVRFPTTLAVIAAATLLVSTPAAAQLGVSATFDRSYTVGGNPDLDVRTSSGSVTVRRGSGTTIQVHGEIRVANRWFGSTTDADIKQVEQNPPITQTGNAIKIDRLPDEARWRGIAISYDIAVPESTKVQVSTGSGGVKVNGVASVRATTGSGSIHVSDIKGEVDAHTGSGGVDAQSVGGAFRGETGSGSIDATLRQSGPVNVETGSGSIRVEGVKGGVTARTGSGSITLEGDPTADWMVNTGSGGVTLRLPSTAKFDLHAHTGSGRITSDHPVTVHATERRSLEGQVRGGGPRLDLKTSSGSIKIQ
jgi:DUF4097 and DUF4098 domain-containing protein YvlB